MKISEAIKEIIKLRDLAIFGEYKKFIAMLADFSTGTHKKELDVFKNAVDENMLKMCIDDSLENSRKILKLQIQLENKGLSQDWINFIIESLALSLGWNYTPKPITQQQQLQTQQVQKQNTSSSQKKWTCSCGTVNTANFCGNCGSAKPVPQSLDWTCICGTVNTTKFCTTCGKKKGDQQAEEEARKRAEEEERKRAEEEERKRAEEEERRRAEEEERRKGEEARRKGEEARRKGEEARRKGEEARRNFKNANVGDYIVFGSYPQTANGGILPIEWLVLAKENDKILVISKYGLETRWFDSSSNNWENSEIRRWLNIEFYYEAFNENEKKLIRNSRISTKVYKDGFLGLWKNEKLTESGEHVFLLSKEEAEKYFANDKERDCKATDYAKKNGACVSNKTGCGYWWLRSPADPIFIIDVYCVCSGGYFDVRPVNCRNCGNLIVRPAMWINL